MALFLNTLGGLGLFLLAMSMMTDGLRVFGGRGLRLLLERWTTGRLRSALSGTLVTTLVQSSTAVTVATIGFVNAGMLDLPQALGVVFGANVGTTFTGWLVSITGFGFKIEAFAMPIIALGVVVRLVAAQKSIRALGEAIAGFGLFFLGLAILKNAFSGVTETFGQVSLEHRGLAGLFLFLLAGFVATLLTQSSSAAMALILTAASQSAIGLTPAAAAIIGANIGTTSTAAFAAIGATPNAKRVAAGHILFNVATATVAVAILPLLLRAIDAFGHLVGMDNHPAMFLALFHTVFNLLGVALMLPLTGPLSRLLQRAFVSAEEDLSHARYLDRTLIATPPLALAALKKELARLSDLVDATALAAVQGKAEKPLQVERHSAAIAELGLAVSEFATRVRMEDLDREQAEHLPRLLRIARYLEEAAHLIPHAAIVRRDFHRIADPEARDAVHSLLEATERFLNVLTAAAVAQPEALKGLDTAIFGFQNIYQSAKAGLLRSAASGRLNVEQLDHHLDALSRMRRMVDQLAKASRMLADEAFFLEESARPETPVG